MGKQVKLLHVSEEETHFPVPVLFIFIYFILIFLFSSLKEKPRAAKTGRKNVLLVLSLHSIAQRISVCQNLSIKMTQNKVFQVFFSLHHHADIKIALGFLPQVRRRKSHLENKV